MRTIAFFMGWMMALTAYSQLLPDTSYTVESIIKTLSQPTLMGREPGSSGSKKTADYIANYFKIQGLEMVNLFDHKSYRMPFPRKAVFKINALLVIDGDTLNPYEQVFQRDKLKTASAENTSVIFLGYASQQAGYNELSGIKKGDFTGKVVVFWADTPGMNRTKPIKNSHFGSVDQRIVGIKLIGGEPAAVFVITSNFRKKADENKSATIASGNTISFGNFVKGSPGNSFWLSDSVWQNWLNKSMNQTNEQWRKKWLKKKGLGPITLPFKADIIIRLPDIAAPPEHIIGYLKGDSCGKPFVVVTSYSGLGATPTANYLGASREGASTAAMLQLIHFVKTRGKELHLGDVYFVALGDADSSVESVRFLNPMFKQINPELHWLFLHQLTPGPNGNDPDLYPFQDPLNMSGAGPEDLSFSIPSQQLKMNGFWFSSWPTSRPWPWSSDSWNSIDYQKLTTQIDRLTLLFSELSKCPVKRK